MLMRRSMRNRSSLPVAGRTAIDRFPGNCEHSLRLAVDRPPANNQESGSCIDRWRPDWSIVKVDTCPPTVDTLNRARNEEPTEREPAESNLFVDVTGAFACTRVSDGAEHFIRLEINRLETIKKLPVVNQPAQLDALFDGVH